MIDTPLPRIENIDLDRLDLLARLELERVPAALRHLSPLSPLTPGASA